VEGQGDGGEVEIRREEGVDATGAVE